MNDSSQLTNAGSEPEERVIEAALRPRNLDDFVGQGRVRQQLSLCLRQRRSASAPPTTYCSRDLPDWEKRHSR